MKSIQNLELKNTDTAVTCYHCGESCPDSSPQIGDKAFCCNGCKLVYELLESKEMCDYYEYTKSPGFSPAEAGIQIKFKYLEDFNIRQKLINFSDGHTASVTFYIPSIHCSSCIFLLENLIRLNPLIHSSHVNYLKKEVHISYEDTATSLRQIVELLSSVGYEPQINLDSIDEKKSKKTNRDLYLKLGVAGFCSMNILMLHFPEYLAGDQGVDENLGNFFNYLSIFLSLPVLFYSSNDYFKSAFNALRQKMVNMDVPISLGVITLFVRSIYEIITATGSGYLDSFTGLIFLLLVGKIFEKKTYDSLSFERDYKSYFPISVFKKTDEGETSIPLNNLVVKDRIIVRNQEIIPADSVLIRGQAYIDYSFVTGESTPVEKKNGEIIYAGGKQVGGMLELDVIKDVNQSYLTEIWNDDTFTKPHHSNLTSAANAISRYFTLIVLSIALGSTIYWAPTNWDLALNAFTAVLIVACPCALALSTPFTLGNTLRVFGWNKFYLKNTAVIEALARIRHIVFDKTGTITHSSEAKVEKHFNHELTEEEEKMVYGLAKQSLHPLSQYIAKFLYRNNKLIQPDGFKEEAGKGIRAKFDGEVIRLGSAEYVGLKQEDKKDLTASFVHLTINDVYRGYFSIQHAFRKGLNEAVESLKKIFKISLLTGDNDREQSRVQMIFGDEAFLFFNQSPFDKLSFIKKSQKKGERILMVGDGLNDAGALKQSDVGITLSENINSFSPASDAILDAKNFHRLPDFIDFSRKSMRIILISFIISFLYNTIGLYFAVQGTLSPLIAAILMPASSISVVLFTTGSVLLLSKKLDFKLFRKKAEMI